MNTELQRQRVARFQEERERYLQTRRKAIQPTLAPNRELISTRHRYLPATLVAPFALLAIAGMLDLLFLVTGNGFWNSVSFAMIPAGVIGSIAVVVVGAHDWLAAPAGSRARGVGVWFAIGAALAVTIFIQSWVARFGIASDDGGLGVVLGYIGAAIALLTGWLLGEFLERLSALERAEAAAPEPPDQITGPHRIEDVVVQRKVANA